MNKKNRLNVILNDSKLELSKIVMQGRLQDTDVSILVKPLTPEEAIGQPGRRDFPIIIGKERVIEAQVLGAKGHSFTDSPADFTGRLSEILALPLETNTNRALFIAAMNATLRHLNLCEKTVHCKNEEPTKCAKEIAAHILEKWGKVRVGLIGLNPAIGEELVETFGADNVKITDLDLQNINASKFGLKIWDGREKTNDLIKQSEVVVITGTTFVNGTFDYIMAGVREHKKDYLVYGVTGAGICKLMGLNRICPYGRN
ncbi:MAG TPA: hypothetical protein HPP87_12090 [Planctomycetes bacterium]|nr:hypothetical protein [Planctomycetota bacterium]HIJ72082.1 hypothetical protein [Planctomycetota bacterium]